MHWIALQWPPEAGAAAERGGDTRPPPGRPKAAGAPSGGSGPREAGERGGDTRPPPGRPKAAGAPSGGSGPREAGERGGEHLAWWALRFTPRVAWVDEALLLEVSPTLRLWGGVSTLRARIIEENPAPALMDIAQSAIGIVAIARLRLRREGLAVPAGGVAALPLHTLGAARAHLPLLARLGCRTWGDAHALPRGPMARRFGPGLRAALDVAWGLAPECYPWLTLPERFDQSLELPAHVDDAPALLWAASRLLTALQHWLAARQQGVLAFELAWTLDARRLDGRPQAASAPSGDNAACEAAERGSGIVIRTAQPAQAPAHLRRLLAERLAHTRLPAPAVGLRLRALQTAPWRPGSASLLPGEQRRGEPLHVLIERASARLGPASVRRAVPRADHRPECMQAWRPAEPAQAEAGQGGGDTRPPPGRPKAAEAPSGGSGPREAGERGGLVRPPPGRPKAAEAPSGGSGPREAGERGGDTRPPPGRPKAAGAPLGGSGPREAGERGGDILPDALAPTWLLREPLPLAVRDGQPCHRGAALRLLTSPRRVEAGWWSGAVQEEGAGAARDYFVAQGAAAELLWVYRERPTSQRPDAAPRWFLQGLYA